MQSIDSKVKSSSVYLIFSMMGDLFDPNFSPHPSSTQLDVYPTGCLGDDRNHSPIWGDEEHVNKGANLFTIIDENDLIVDMGFNYIWREPKGINTSAFRPFPPSKFATNLLLYLSSLLVF